MSKAKDLRDQTVEELQATLIDTKKELFELKNEIKVNKKIEKPHQLSEKRRNVARLMTIMNEKKNAVS